MKRFLLLFFIPLCVASGQKIRVPSVTRDTLDNGLTIILMEYHKVPVVHLRLVVRGGSAHDPEGFPGVASMMTSLMTEGTTSRSSGEIADAIDFVGGSLTVGAGLDYSAANLGVLKKDFDAGLALFADVILHPSFPDEEIERVRNQQLAGIDAMKEDPSSIASFAFSSQLYGSHPYGSPYLGTKSSVRSITRDQLTACYNLLFVPERAVLVAVGDFDARSMLTVLRDAFAAWKRGNRSLPSIPPPSQAEGRTILLVNKPDVTQTQIRIGAIGIAMNDPDYVPLIVANTVFGSGFTSRLMEELRVKRSLTYGVWSGFTANRSGGSFVIGTFTKNETVRETIDVVLHELKKFRHDGMSDVELRKGRNYLAGDFARSLQTPEELASNLTDIELYGLPADFLETYIERIRSVTPDQIRSAVNRHFPQDDLLMVLVTPTGEKEPDLSGFGQVGQLALDEVFR